MKIKKELYSERVFSLSPKQIEKFEKWRKKKNKKNGEPYVGAIGGSYSFIFIPTSLGTISKVRCVDGNEVDLTDENEFS